MYSDAMSTPVQPAVAARWYEDAEKLKQKREEAGVSAEVLAQRIGRHPSYVSNAK